MHYRLVSPHFNLSPAQVSGEVAGNSQRLPHVQQAHLQAPARPSAGGRGAPEPPGGVTEEGHHCSEIGRLSHTPKNSIKNHHTTGAGGLVPNIHPPPLSTNHHFPVELNWCAVFLVIMYCSLQQDKSMPCGLQTDKEEYSNQGRCTKHEVWVDTVQYVQSYSIPRLRETHYYYHKESSLGMPSYRIQS